MCNIIYTYNINVSNALRANPATALGRYCCCCCCCCCCRSCCCCSLALYFRKVGGKKALYCRSSEEWVTYACITCSHIPGENSGRHLPEGFLRYWISYIAVACQARYILALMLLARLPSPCL